MGRKNKYTKETKIKFINEYNNGIKSLSEICNELDCSKRNFLDWVHMFNLHGKSIFDDKITNSTYTKDFKEKVVKEYLNGNGSLRGIQSKYKILSPKTLRKWILKYNNGIILTDYKPIIEVYTMKTRKVTYKVQN